MPRDQVGESELAREVARVVLPRHLPAPVDPVGGLLIRARKRIEREEDWFCGKSIPVIPNTGLGRSCIHLAIMHADGSRSLKDEALRTVARAIGNTDATATSILCDIWRFNDSHTHADVLALFDRAISSRKAEG